MNRRGFVSLPVLVMVSVGILMVPVVKYIKGEQIVGINQLGTLVDGVDLRGLIDVNDRVEDKGEESVSDINKRIQEKFNKRQAERIEKEEQERSSLRPDNLNDMIQMESEQKKEPSAESQRWQGLSDLYQGKDGAVSDLVQENLPQEIKDYIRWIGNRRLIQLGLEPIYKIDKNPLTWLDTMLNAVEHMNFFEGRATEYSKASTQGSWTEAFS